MMYTGIGVAEGTAVGGIVTFRHASVAGGATLSPEPRDPGAEFERFLEGRKKVVCAFERLVRETTERFGSEKAGIFEGYIEILQDGEIENSVGLLLKEGLDAESAVHSALSALAAEFSCMEGDYMKERAADMEDLGRRLLNAISGREEARLPFLSEPSVLVADDLSPAETVRLDLSRVLALLVDRGGPTSHVAILSRSLGIPCVVGLKDFSSCVRDGQQCAVDGKAGVVILHPSPDDADRFRARSNLHAQISARLAASAGEPAVTSDGTSVQVCANLGSAEEAEMARARGADGVGLFRTEFLYMDGDRLPSEEEQLEVYTRALRSLGGRPLTIRTLDIGGDKELPALGLSKEENPFLGYRAVRVALDRPDVLKPQLRAVLRAAALGPVELMFPLVISVDEVRRLMSRVGECRSELEAEGVPVGPCPVGIMVETPAAALMARELATLVDFFSIGTNDLTQYTLAVDRGNAKIAGLYDPFNPAVLRLVSAICEAAREAGIPVCMCGEFASDERALPLLVGFGLDTLSVASSRIPAIKERVRSLDSSACRSLAREALHRTSVSDVLALLGEGAGSRT